MSTAQAIIRKWFRISPSQRRLIIESLFLLAITRCVIIVLPFSAVSRLASRQISKPSSISADTRAALLRQVRTAVLVCAPRVPWRAKCFEQGLTAHLMLRRRGIPTVLCYGALRDLERGLLAHVWVLDGDHYVIGGELAPKYRVLMTFPSNAVI
jgi:hypothetical protein